jgi:hypothetical protein
MNLTLRIIVVVFVSAVALPLMAFTLALLVRDHPVSTLTFVQKASFYTFASLGAGAYLALSVLFIKKDFP